METPKWTVVYNIAPVDYWVGTGWQFFKEKEKAEKFQKERNNAGDCASLRPFHALDAPHLGACHSFVDRLNSIYPKG